MNHSLFLITMLGLLATGINYGQTTKPRARDLGIPFDGTPGKFNAITDVAGVEVGMVTLIQGNGKLTEDKNEHSFE